MGASSSNIQPQSMTITVNGLKNPTSTAFPGSFFISTYYQSNDNYLVATGTIAGVNATKALIDPTKFSIMASSYVINDVLVSYSFQLNVVNMIPAGGYFSIYIPS